MITFPDSFAKKPASLLADGSNKNLLKLESGVSAVYNRKYHTNSEYNEKAGTSIRQSGCINITSE